MTSSATSPGSAASRVEQYFLSLGPQWPVTPEQERVKVIAVGNYAILGQLAALRFLEWADENPEGVAALPTGKTPEYFIKWVQHYLAHWEAEAAASGGLFDRVGLGGRPKPRLDGLRFVQLDEFFPIRPDHERSFAWFVRRFYLEGFGLDPCPGPPHRHLPSPRGAGGGGLPPQGPAAGLRRREHRSGPALPPARERGGGIAPADPPPLRRVLRGLRGAHPRPGRHRLLPGRASGRTGISPSTSGAPATIPPRAWTGSITRARRPPPPTWAASTPCAGRR